MKPNLDIKAAVDAIRVIDTHEHQEEESGRLRRPLDFVSLFAHYAVDDFISTGMTEADWQRCDSPDTPLDEKWRLFEPVYHAARNTAYVKAVEIAIRDLYNIDRLDGHTAIQLTQRIDEQNKPGIVKYIFQERAGIDLAQVNAIDGPMYRVESDRSLFMQDIGIMSLLSWPLPIEQLERESGVTIKSFKDYGQAIEALFDRFAPCADAVKQQSAYWRAQYFGEVTDADAERVFDAAAKDPKAVSEAEQTVIQDWALHRCLQLCTEHDLPMKIHTGYKAGRNYMDLDHIHPARLTNLFIKYPKARFDLFHISYPYQEELLALAKHFTNVYVDMCWAWIIDPLASRRFLKQFIAAVPASKLFAFGGDYIIAEPIYGHLRIARDQIALGLTELFDEGYLSVPQAVDIAGRILRQNAIEVFHIDQKRHATPPLTPA